MFTFTFLHFSSAIKQLLPLSWVNLTQILSLTIGHGPTGFEKYLINFLIQCLQASLLHTLLSCDQSCSWRSTQSRVEVYSLVKMSANKIWCYHIVPKGLAQPHLYITSLLLSLLIGEVAEPLAGHPEEVDQLSVMGVGHEHLYQALHKPCAMLVVP